MLSTTLNPLGPSSVRCSCTSSANSASSWPGSGSHIGNGTPGDFLKGTIVLGEWPICPRREWNRCSTDVSATQRNILHCRQWRHLGTFPGLEEPQALQLFHVATKFLRNIRRYSRGMLRVWLRFNPRKRQWAVPSVFRQRQSWGGILWCFGKCSSWMTFNLNPKNIQNKAGLWLVGSLEEPIFSVDGAGMCKPFHGHEAAAENGNMMMTLCHRNTKWFMWCLF